MTSQLGQALLQSQDNSSHGIHGIDPPQRFKPKRTQAAASQIQMFLHGGKTSIVTEQGEYNIHRMVPRLVKYYLNWTRDTFPSVVRLSWVSLMTLFICVKLFTIAFFAAIMRSVDGTHDRECVTNASSYSDFFYFVVQTIFTIGYGEMSPVCHWSNMMVTVISFFGMFQTATFTGIFFAKFSMDPRRNYACAFSTQLVGIPPRALDPDSGDEMVRFNFRFVNVFHRRYFKVSCKLYLVEHRMNMVNERWLSPLVEELEFFDTSAPMEFMSLPVEVCCYVPYSRLVKDAQFSQVSPGMSPVDSPVLRTSYPNIRIPHVRQHHRDHKWIRHFSQDNFSKRTGTHNVPVVHSTPRQGADIPLNCEFEIMCMLVFTDATTGCEMAVRKSWPLADTVWLANSETSVKWKDVIYRDENSDKYLVDVTGLDTIENEAPGVTNETLLSEGMSPVNSLAFRLMNSMTVPARGSGGVHQRARASDLFPSAIPEEKV